jgi:predicted nucleic acid-binding protein
LLSKSAVRAIDTNILVRLATGDDSAQHLIATRILEEPFILLPTVLMETIWVLQSRYRMTCGVICERLRRLTGHPMTENVAGEAVVWALEQFEHGADFADMLHIALAAQASGTRFATFDQGIAKRSNSLPISIEILT